MWVSDFGYLFEEPNNDSRTLLRRRERELISYVVINGSCKRGLLCYG
jgi:hypothetical protein